MKDYASSIVAINRGEILSDSDAEFVASNIQDIQDNWDKRQVFRTETEMRISVLNDLKHPTAASKYWQCVREQAVFYENLVALSFDYRRNKIEQKKLDGRIKDAGGLDRELLQIDLEELQFRQLNMEQVGRERARELRLWAKIMGEFDLDSFDSTDVNTHQLLSYGLRFEGQLKNIGNASPSEMANLVGQYDTTVKHLQSAGILNTETE